MRRSRLPLALVSWHDAGAGADVAESKAHHRISAGYLVENNDEGVVLSMEDDVLSGVSFVPRAIVEEVKIVRK